MTKVWDDAELQSALERCQETVSEPLPCNTAEYLVARRAYHVLLVDRGLMNPKDVGPLRLT